MKYPSMEQLLEKLAEEGGTVISSARCGSSEIDKAQAEGRMTVTDAGYGYIWRPEDHEESCISYPKTLPEFPDCVYLRDGMKIAIGRDRNTKGRAWLRVERQQIIRGAQS